MAFCAREALPGVYQIQDCMGVCMTLLVGQRAALLVDTGYGLEDVQAYIRTKTQLPLEVVLTHGHHDHCLGARWFAQTYMFPADEKDFRTYTGRKRGGAFWTAPGPRGLPWTSKRFCMRRCGCPPLSRRAKSTWAA